MTDHVDGILAQWRRERPDLDTSPMAVIGRLSRAANAVGARLDRTFAAYDLDRGSFDVLATLLRNGPPHRLTPAGLAADAMITSAAVAHLATEQGLLADLAPGERETLAALLARVLRNAGGA
jgi:hypothetical protein